MSIPIATYRIQLHKDFTLQQLSEIIDYLHALGISTVYASPITRAPDNSLHGYDVTDPHQLNPVIGTLEEWRAITRRLQEKNMNWLQDIVPNHMSFSSANWRLMDVLERGRLSPYASYFDILWQHPHFGGRLMVPFLGVSLADGVRDGSVRLTVAADGIYVATPGDRYPLSIGAYYLLFVSMMARDTAMQLAPAITHLALVSMQERTLEQWQQMKSTVLGAALDHPQHRQQVEALIDLVNSRHDWLLEILHKQYYRLCHWQEVNTVIDYRRFFTVTSLICLRMEDERVFDEYHAFLHQLYQEGLVQGLRIDHIDGLYAPGEYVQRLRALFGEECYLIAEKILAENEYLPPQWPLQGTSGYEFLAYVNQLFADQEGMQELERFYRRLLPDLPAYPQIVINNKRMILEQYMAGELDNLVQLFAELGLAKHNEQLKWRAALAAIMIHLPVYRTYPVEYPLSASETTLLQDVIAEAIHASPAVEPELNYLRQLLTGQDASSDKGRKILQFLKRLMQFTGPLMAKGVEDTTFYQYNAFIGHNEVGDSPAIGGMSVRSFHTLMKERLLRTPQSLNATSTHDTKRGEDARMRLAVLTTMTEAWETAVQEWMIVNDAIRQLEGERRMPDTNEEYFIYQSLIAGWPADGLCNDGLVERLKAYLTKALREAKQHTRWETPDEQYETACHRFIDELLHPAHAFLASFTPFAQQVARKAEDLSLGQVLIKITAPGIPDIYQGCERWDLTYVDPDNRRPIDYATGKLLLNELQLVKPTALMDYLAAHRADGAAKLYITWKALQCRQESAAVFAEGDYRPLDIKGQEVTTLAYARTLDDAWVIVAVPLQPLPDDRQLWQIQLPDQAPQRWRNIFTGEDVAVDENNMLPAGIGKGDFPVGCWVSIR
ncbi:malto-oligosyltrehalose synthase [Paraflavitalea pollutisoli]|uniref:malto-oligosyltrehalose synthase n=1 Tax=Paraflavitalea pollutisoli TaxID=3034143 RepID=UPI0023EDEFBA|nr:malto-oligosyltrehalose synthase [Paraflavitalea sp. H1-2-19X]